MSGIPLTTQPDIQRRLVQALGFGEEPSHSSVKPYLSYITSHYNGQDDLLDDWLELFIRVVQHFDQTINNAQTPRVPQNAGIANVPSLPDSINALIRKITADAARKLKPSEVEDKVMYILGIWSMMEHSFQRRNQLRAIVHAYGMFATPTKPPYDTNLKGLLIGSGLLPGGARDHYLKSERDSMRGLAALLSQTSASPVQGPRQNINFQLLGSLQTSLVRPVAAGITSPSLADIDAVESQSIAATRLNAFTLRALSAVEVRWTYNISRHMLLATSNDCFFLELFCLPCAFPALQQPAVGVTEDLIEEIQGSYAMLFNAWYKKPLHLRLGSTVALHRWCWCWSCSARRYCGKCIQAARDPPRPGTLGKMFRKHASPLRSAPDPLLEGLIKEKPYDAWSPQYFPLLWPRVLQLEQHLQTSRPWSLWVLFRDRRDTFQFWTFLFATVVVFLTVVQVVLGGAQVAGSFK